MKTIMDMALETGAILITGDTPSQKSIKAFAELVRAEAQAEEREACAKVCEGLGMATNGMHERNHECAAAIRARGNT